jgi:hypothetical protein
MMNNKQQILIKFKDDILEWCYKNNSIKIKYSKLALLTTDGGWVNVLELKDFMENKLKSEEKKE